MPLNPERPNSEMPEQKLEIFLNGLTMNPDTDKKTIAALSEGDLLGHYTTLQESITIITDRLRAKADELNRSARSQTRLPWDVAGGAEVRKQKSGAEDLNYQADYMWSIIGFLGDEIEKKRKIDLPPSMAERDL